MSDVPDDLLREILKRLPVAPLLRFRCVSKRWRGLINGHQFLKDHLNHSSKTNSNVSIINRCRYLHSADFDLLDKTNMATFQELSHPLKTPSLSTEIVGSCDGVLALSNGEEDIILWNPSIRRFELLPVIDIEFPDFTSCEFIVYGFGYDSVSADYKFIRIVQFSGRSGHGSEVKVFSLKSFSWKRIADFPYYLKYRQGYGELANDALHWIVSMKASDTDSLVAAFDLATEEYRLVPLPEVTQDKEVLMNVLELRGCLGLICNHYKVNDHVDIWVNDHVDIWVMKEYGVKESWSILFTLRQTDICFKQFECVKPIAYSKCGRKVLLALDDNGLIWYDLDNKSIDIDQPMLPMPSDNNYFEFYTCLQSLVLLEKGRCDINIVGMKKSRKKRKYRSGKKDFSR